MQKYRVLRTFRDKFTLAIHETGGLYPTDDIERAADLHRRGFIDAGETSAPTQGQLFAGKDESLGHTTNPGEGGTAVPKKRGGRKPKTADPTVEVQEPEGGEDVESDQSE
ncbi:MULTISPECIES: hypothetical protein [unclassified Paenibacillus]|uniref:hypothetical protein n=1 Tax=unclassified Paenibacillus TaxID=185978 RepID=UPI000931DD34|nr:MULTISPECIES: hypothetical protein [unclassified Paenibacillus]